MIEKKKLILVVLIICLLSSASLLLSQFEPGSNTTQDYQSQTQSKKTSSSFSKWFAPTPPTYWIKINAFGIITYLVIILAFILGFVNMFFGYNAGGKGNIKKVQRCVLYTVIVAILAKPIFNLIHLLLAKGLSLIPFIPYEIAAGIVGLFVNVLWVSYIAFGAVLLYETFVVTAKEAHPMT